MKGSYGQSSALNFRVIDAIGVPHPYCITPKHVEIAADFYSGMLGEAAIEDAEKHGAHCGMVGCQLAFRQHEQALLVECNIDFKSEAGEKELRAYLLQIKDAASANGYAGFAFKQNF